MLPDNLPDNSTNNNTENKTYVRINTYDPDDQDTYLLPYEDDSYYDDTEYVRGLSRSHGKRR